MSINTNEPLQIKKMCGPLLMSAVPQTDEQGMYHGKAPSIWITTRDPLSKEQRQRLEELGVTLSSPAPAYSRDSSFVYTAELQPGANLKAFLALPMILHVRVSETLSPLPESTPTRGALEELQATSGASYSFIELLGREGVSQRAQRVILTAVENLVAPGDAEREDCSAYKDCFIAVVHSAIRKTSGPGRGYSEGITSTSQLAKALQDVAVQELSADPHPTSQALARDVGELGEQLALVATPRRVR